MVCSAAVSEDCREDVLRKYGYDSLQEAQNSESAAQITGEIMECRKDNCKGGRKSSKSRKSKKSKRSRKSRKSRKSRSHRR